MSACSYRSRCRLMGSIKHSPRRRNPMKNTSGLLNNLVRAVLCVWVISLLGPCPVWAQLLNFSKQDLLDYTAQAPFDRFTDGRPKVSNDLLERARELSSEEVWSVLEQRGFHNQYADG